MDGVIILKDKFPVSRKRNTYKHRNPFVSHSQLSIAFKSSLAAILPFSLAAKKFKAPQMRIPAKIEEVQYVLPLICVVLSKVSAFLLQSSC